MRKYITKLWWCKIMNWHEWTCKQIEGIDPETYTIEDFLDQCTMYCKRCGKVSQLSKKLNEKYLKDHAEIWNRN